MALSLPWLGNSVDAHTVHVCVCVCVCKVKDTPTPSPATFTQVRNPRHNDFPCVLLWEFSAHREP